MDLIDLGVPFRYASGRAIRFTTCSLLSLTLESWDTKRQWSRKQNQKLIQR